MATGFEVRAKFVDRMTMSGYDCEEGAWQKKESSDASPELRRRHLGGLLLAANAAL